ncbi:hypothetical protein [Bradyrhizobium sp. S3.7.6]
MNALTNTNQTGIAVDQDFDPFSAYGATAGTRIIGKLLKFNKGDWLVGQNGDIMQEGTELAANMNELLVGWIKWKDKKPAEQLLVPLIDSVAAMKRGDLAMAKREALGDTDESQWETDDDGKPQDPWQQTNYLLFKVPGLDDQDALFTFTASSRGAINAVKALCTDFGKQKRMWARGEMPVVKLLVDKYKHDKYGWVKIPLFKIVGKVSPAEFEAAMAEEAAQKAADDAGRKAADEDIPF